MCERLPHKLRTVQRYSAVLDHVKRILGHKTFVEVITRTVQHWMGHRSLETTMVFGSGARYA